MDVKFPIILLVGKANAGKDTTAKLFAESLNGCVISLSDPIKRFAHKLGFTEKQLWGPSEFRDKVDKKFSGHTFCSNQTKTAATSWVSSLKFSLSVKNQFDLLNEILNDLSNIAQKGVSARTVLQMLGTEFARTVDKDVWVNTLIDSANKLLNGSCSYDRVYGVYNADDHLSSVIVPDGRFKSEILAVKRLGGTIIKVNSIAQIIGGIDGHSSELEQDSIPEWYYDYVLFNDKELGMPSLTSKIKSIVDDITKFEAFSYDTTFGGSSTDVLKKG